MFSPAQSKRLGKRVHQRRALPFAVQFTFVLFVFTLPFEGLLDTIPAFSLAKLFGYIFFASFLLCPKMLVNQGPGALPMKWFLGYLIISSFGLFAVGEDNLRPTIMLLFRLVQLFVFFFVASKILTDARLAIVALWSFCLSCALLAILTVGVPGFSIEPGPTTAEPGPTTARHSALEYGASFVGYLMALSLLGMVGLWIFGKLQHRWQNLILLALALPCLVLLFRSGSRAAVGAFVLGFLVFLLLESGFRKQGAAVLVVFLAAFVLHDLVESSAIRRWTKTYDEGDLAGREDMYPAALAMIRERPILGWTRYQEELADRTGGRYFGGTRNAHSLLLHLLLQVGIVGAIPFFVAVAIISWRTWRARRGRFGVLPLALLVAILAFNLVHTGLHKPVWLFFALAVASYSTSKQKRPPDSHGFLDLSEFAKKRLLDSARFRDCDIGRLH